MSNAPESNDALTRAGMIRIMDDNFERMFVCSMSLACWRVEAPSRPGHWVPAARSSGYLAWTQVGYLRSPGDPSYAFAPLLDPGRTDVPSP